MVSSSMLPLHTGIVWSSVRGPQGSVAGLSVRQSGEEQATACNSGPELRSPDHVGANTQRNPLVPMDALP